MYSRPIKEWSNSYVCAQPLPTLIFLGIQDEWLSAAYLQFVNDHAFFSEVCAGAKHHHWWVGGLREHVVEIIGYMAEQLLRFPDAYGDITIQDCIISAILHDFDKIWMYVPLTEAEQGSGKFHERQQFKSTSEQFLILDGSSKLLLELSRAGIVPTDKVWSAVLFAHAGYSDANFGYGGLTRTGGTVNLHNKLAVLLNMADMFSSQILGKSIA